MTVNNIDLVNIDSDISKKVLNSIIKKEKIEFEKLNILNLKNKVTKLKKEYEMRLKSSKHNKKLFKNQIFWELLEKKLVNYKITYKNRSQEKKNDKFNILFSDLSKSLGFTPSLLFLLIFSEKTEQYLKVNKLYQEIKKILDGEELNNTDKINFFNAFLKKKIIFVTPLCPDYAHIKIADGFYKYTFKKLNDGLGLIGKRFISVMDKLYEVLNKNKINYTHYLLYGDFESYSKNICRRLKISEKQFIEKVERSAQKMKKNTKGKCKVGLIVKNFTDKKRWTKTCRLNEKRIKKKYNNDIKFKKLIEEITNSRKMLYSSWFPNLEKKNYKSIVIKQGAEYSSMGEIFFSKLKNPIVIALDHPKMKTFYGINSNITVIYGKPRYV